ncbi:hypothetical protein BAOM_0419 [Peribacillus asahii]|uniref:Uncharacterized protein n=1 Tax=Peribacillus asahii TaxID=228899 RepID=A0A3T0KKZ4_9BACI|nr:hypothetical protein [Peribacillus asahii]AZV41079.1 hypothetical protein BAOM_0419 [Peribacillus asahii]
MLNDSLNIKKEQINYEIYGEVNSLIDQCYEIIREYYETKYEELSTTLKTEGEKLKESIKEKEERNTLIN